MISDEDELIQEILQRAWTELLALRKEDKIKNFDINVPSQILSWVEDIYRQQIPVYEKLGENAIKNKRFAIAVTFRVAINNIIGIDYFLNEMRDTAKMRAVDKLIDDLYTIIRKQNAMKSELR